MEQMKWDIYFRMWPKYWALERCLTEETWMPCSSSNQGIPLLVRDYEILFSMYKSPQLSSAVNFMKPVHSNITFFLQIYVSNFLFLSAGFGFTNLIL